MGLFFFFWGEGFAPRTIAAILFAQQADPQGLARIDKYFIVKFIEANFGSVCVARTFPPGFGKTQ